jgi:hypothetical protein
MGETFDAFSVTGAEMTVMIGSLAARGGANRIASDIQCL